MVITCHGYFRVSARNLCAGVIIFLNQQRERHDHIGIQFTGDRHFLRRGWLLREMLRAQRDFFLLFQRYANYENYH